jgi:hypothetical protein
MTRLPLAFALLPLAAPSGTTVQAVDNAFRPATVTVAPGDTVTWHNSGSAPHDVTAAAFKSGNLDPGKSFTWTATAAGRYSYVCRYHQSVGMTGTVVVATHPKTGGDRTALGLLVLGISAAAGLSLRYGWRLR